MAKEFNEVHEKSPSKSAALVGDESWIILFFTIFYTF